jgi:oligopeptide transport system substrate-binding protein
MDNLDYDVARRGWVADYPDPSTFTDLMESTNGNNNTGWSNREYDRLMEQARGELDPVLRMELLRRGEEILLQDTPVLPIYSYSSINLIKPYVRGFRPSPTDEYPLHELWIDYQWRERAEEPMSARND